MNYNYKESAEYKFHQRAMEKFKKLPIEKKTRNFVDGNLTVYLRRNVMDCTIWYNSNGQLHREDGPAYISIKGTQEWWINGKRHREDGPARIYVDGTQEWWIDNLLHREGGPAVTDCDGTQWWYRNGQLYRIIDGYQAWYRDGNYRVWYIDGNDLTVKLLNSDSVNSEEPSCCFFARTMGGYCNRH